MVNDTNTKISGHGGGSLSPLVPDLAVQEEEKETIPERVSVRLWTSPDILGSRVKITPVPESSSPTSVLKGDFSGTTDEKRKEQEEYVRTMTKEH